MFIKYVTYWYIARSTKTQNRPLTLLHSAAVEFRGRGVRAVTFMTTHKHFKNERVNKKLTLLDRIELLFFLFYILWIRHPDLFQFRINF